MLSRGAEVRLVQEGAGTSFPTLQVHASRTQYLRVRTVDSLPDSKFLVLNKSGCLASI